MKPGLLEEWLEAAAEFFDGQGADVLGVEPDGFGIEGIFFGKIHHRIGAVDAFEGEQAANLVQSQELAIVLGRPAEQTKEVDEGLGQKAGIAIGGDADHRAVFALGELGAVGRDQQRQMGELRRRRSESLEDQQVLDRCWSGGPGRG